MSDSVNAYASDTDCGDSDSDERFLAMLQIKQQNKANSAPCTAPRAPQQSTRVVE